MLEVRHVDPHAAVAVQHPLDRRAEIFRQRLERFRIVALAGPRFFTALHGDLGWLAVLLLDVDLDAVWHRSTTATDDHAVPEVAELHRAVAAQLAAAELLQHFL